MNDLDGAIPLNGLTSLLVKIASRCNLSCDYCYVYTFADQMWKQQPRIMSENNRRLLALRIAEYLDAFKLDTFHVIFHGGEPLLAGAETIDETARWIRESAPEQTSIRFSLQTNGVLLNNGVLDILEKERIRISISLDGPKWVNDLHRFDKNGRSSFDQVRSAIDLLQERSDYGGILAVIDPFVPPKELLEFFDELKPPGIDLLLPDANYLYPPPHRISSPNIYTEWLLDAFDLWLDDYPQIPIRIFDTLFSRFAGLGKEVNAFGVMDVYILTVETDGNYHDLDVLKITASDESALGMSLESATITEAVGSFQATQHRKLLQSDGLSEKCKSCKVLDYCWGGYVPHRYDNDGFIHPTVYCGEMIALINHARKRFTELIRSQHKKYKLKATRNTGSEDAVVTN